MIRTQVYLTPEEREGILSVAQTYGKKQSEVIREAIDQFLMKAKPESKLQKLKQAKGMWADRTDVSLTELRKEFDRFE